MTLSETDNRSIIRDWNLIYIFSWLAWASALAIVMAVAMTVTLFGRVPLLALAASLPRSPLMLLVSGVTLAWWLGYGYLLLRGGQRLRWGLAAVPALPILLGVACPLGAVYLSDAVNHHFYYSFVHLNQPKTLVLLLLLVASSIVLQAATLEHKADGDPIQTLRETIRRIQDPLIVVFLLVLGTLQAIVYLEEPAMDFPRYWSIADAMIQGVAYPVTDGGEAFAEGGRALYLIDLPVYPMLLVASFTLLGHTTLASYLPIVIPNAVLPLLTYMLARELVGNRGVALCLAGVITLFPPMRFYTLNWFVQDALFLAELTLCALLITRMAKGDQSKRSWIAFGALDAAMVLTRPEGIAYGFFFALIMISLRQDLRLKAVTASLILIPMASFSLMTLTTFGTPWAESYGGTLKFENVAGSLPVLTEDPYFLDAIRLNSSQLTAMWVVLLVFAIAGSTPFVLRPRRLALLMVPAWFNLAVIYMADPRVSGVRLWFDFFRHMSYPLPLLAIAWGAAVMALCRLTHRPALQTAAISALTGVLFIAVLWNIHYLSEPIPSFGPNAGNLLSQPRVNLVDVIAHPMDLPVLTFERVEQHSRPIFPSEFISRYPDPVSEFYDPFDAGKNMSGRAYQTGTLITFVAALFVALIPGVGISRPSRAPRG